MSLLVLAGASLLGLGATGVVFAGLSLLVDVALGLARRRRPTRPELWHDPVLTEEKEALVYTRERQAGNGLY